MENAPYRNSTNLVAQDAPKSPEMDTAINRLHGIAESFMGLRQRIENMRGRTVGSRLREAKKESEPNKAPTPGHHMARMSSVLTHLESMTVDMATELAELETAI